MRLSSAIAILRAFHRASVRRYGYVKHFHSSAERGNKAQCSSTNHNFEAHPSLSGRIFCTKCGVMRGERQANFPAGIIAMWGGELQHMPKGWVLCDGSNGTPDLRNNFVVGAGGGYTQGTKGGNIQLKLTMENIPSHSHNRNSLGRYELPLIQEDIEEYGSIWGQEQDSFEEEIEDSAKNVIHRPLSIALTGNAGAVDPKPIDVRPPYYAIAFIMLKPT